jgi:muramoyltetrapeptide carboxypeptidase LdcA involved in peptidoglycan recycling
MEQHRSPSAPPKLSPGDKVAILSPSFCAPAVWPHVHELGLKRLRERFSLEPVEYPTTRKFGAAPAERAADLVAAFESPEIKAVFATIGGDDQVVWIKDLPAEPFRRNPKPFFGYSDNTHFMNFLWLNGVPSFYGGAIFTEFAAFGGMDDFTVEYLRHALFGGGAVALKSSATCNDIDRDWSDQSLIEVKPEYEPNSGWLWDGDGIAEGTTWGGCLESVDELLRHGTAIPSLTDFEEIILLLETSEELPSAPYVNRVMRALGERGILGRIRGLLVGRPKGWSFDQPLSAPAKAAYRKTQHEVFVRGVRSYNAAAPIVQNLDFGHTAPQICIPFGGRCVIDGSLREIEVQF